MFPLVLIALIFAAALGFAGGSEYRDNAHAKKELKVQQERARVLKAIEDRQEALALTYANRVSELAQNLGDARVKLYSRTSGKPCLDAGAVSLLNDIGPGLRVPAVAGQPAGPPAAPASDRDVADALAICRSGYARLSEQVNSILDIEDARHRPAEGVAAVRESFRVSQPSAALRP
jgi:hypothetical protein